MLQCGACRATLRKHELASETLDGDSLRREVRVRKSVLDTYNKRREDFASLREFNDYLELVEDIGAPAAAGGAPHARSGTRAHTHTHAQTQ